MPNATTAPESYSKEQFKMFGGRVMKMVDDAYQQVMQARAAAETSTNGQALRDLEAALKDFGWMPRGVQTLMAPYLEEHLQYLTARTGGLDSSTKH